jgi:hypothetical protein
LVWSVDDSTTVVVYTDHNSTLGIDKQTNFKNGTPHKQNLRLVRGSLYLSQFDLVIKHVPGKQNVIPDALSRLLAHETDEDRKCFDEEPDIYEDLFHMQPLILVIHVSDDLLDKLQKGYEGRSDGHF